MLITFEDRGSDSPYIERVWRSHSKDAGIFYSMASSLWGMVVTRLGGKVSFTVRGPETKATRAECPAEGEWVGVLFKLGTYMPLMRCAELRDRNDATLPNATSRSFWLNGSAWEMPGYDNMEVFVEWLVRAGVVCEDSTAKAAILGETIGISTRTEQRRILQVTGLQRGAIYQIERARQAAFWLKRGMRILDVVHEAGYYDQAHLTRSLGRFIGQSPASIAQGREQLSLLYNKSPAAAAIV